MSKTYCPLPWIGLNVLPGAAAPCCQWTGTCKDIKNIEDLNQLNLVDMFSQIRTDMLQGKQISGCEQCYAAERVGVKSRRQESIEQYGVITDVKTKILDVSFDNVCNLKCRGCCSSSSHLWYNEEKELYGKTFVDKKYIEHGLTIDCSELEVVNVSGGEPFLSKKFESFAGDLLKNKEIENLILIISTNGTTIPSGNIYQCMLDAKELRLNISIDGIGDLNHYFRSGASFDQCLKTIEFLKNIKDLRQGKHTYIGIHTTVSIYNVNLLGNIKEFFNINYPEYNLSHRLLYWPQQMCIRYMPEDLKKLVRPYVEELGQDYHDVLQELDTVGDDYFDHFLNFHNSLDSIRFESLGNMNSLLSEYISNKKTTVNSRTFFLKQMDMIS